VGKSTWARGGGAAGKRSGAAETPTPAAASHSCLLTAVRTGPLAFGRVSAGVSRVWSVCDV